MTAGLDLLLGGLPYSSFFQVLAAAALAGLARGFSGFGAALIFIPLVGAVAGPKIASALLLVVDGVLSAGMIPAAWRRASRREVGLMAVGALAGVPVGTLILAWADAITVRWAVDGLVLVLLGLLVSGWRYRGQPKPPLTVGVGAAAGLCSGMAQAGGPPIVAYWLGGAIPAADVRANIIAYFSISTLLTTVTYLIGGLLTIEVLLLAVATAPAYALGLFLGSRLFGLASEANFRRICYVLIAGAAILGLPLLDPWLR
jgi:uncharacterized membrane protein YfcA